MEERIEETLPTKDIKGVKGMKDYKELLQDATINWYYKLDANLSIPEGITLTVGEGAKFIINKNITLTIQQGGELKGAKKNVWITDPETGYALLDGEGNALTEPMGKIIKKGIIKDKLRVDTVGSDNTTDKLTKNSTIHFYCKLEKNLIIPAGITLTIEDEAKLIIPDGKTLTINHGGKLELKTDATIIKKNKEAIIEELLTKDIEGVKGMKGYKELLQDATINWYHKLNADLTIPKGITLTVGEGAKLDIADKKLTIKHHDGLDDHEDSVIVYKGKMEDSIIEELPTDDETGKLLTQDATINWYYKLKAELTIPKGITLTVGEGAKLDIADKKLTIKHHDGLDDHEDSPSYTITLSSWSSKSPPW